MMLMNRFIIGNVVRRTSKHIVIKSKFFSTKNQNKTVGIWGACFDQGQRHPGASEGPGVIRSLGVVETIKKYGVDVVDHGDITEERSDEDTLDNRQKATARFSKKTYDKVREILQNGQLSVTLGGDHSIGLGSVAASLDHDDSSVVFWVDAHADINTMSSSNSGNMHGMPVSFNIPQLKEVFPHANLMDWIKPKLDPRRIVYIGLRDVEESERKILRDLKISTYYMSDVDNMGMKEVVNEALEHVDPEGIRKIHLSFDIDALDPSEASATGTPVRGGLSLREGMFLCDMLHKTGRLQALDMVEVNPKLGNSQDVKTTVESAALLIYSALGLRNIVSFHT